MGYVRFHDNDTPHCLDKVSLSHSWARVLIGLGLNTSVGWSGYEWLEVSSVR